MTHRLDKLVPSQTLQASNGCEIPWHLKELIRSMPFLYSFNTWPPACGVQENDFN